MAGGGTHGSPALSSTAERYSSPADAAALIAPPVLDDLEREAQSAGSGETQGVEVEWGEATAADDVTAASGWWSKILLESGGEVVEGGVESDGAVGCAAEDGVQVAAAAGLPAEWRWLCDDDGSAEQGAVWVTGADDKDKRPDVILETKLADGGEYDYASCYDEEEGGRRSGGGVDGIALPCMDGDIEGWDGGEWFSCSP
ncbi:unnamed protein product [Urochloa humidicola]